MYEENVDVVVGPNSPTWELPEYFISELIDFLISINHTDDNYIIN
jgi:hypothetical protein